MTFKQFAARMEAHYDKCPCWWDNRTTPCEPALAIAREYLNTGRGPRPKNAWHTPFAPGYENPAGELLENLQGPFTLGGGDR